MTDLRSSLIASIEQHDAKQPRVEVPPLFYINRGGTIRWSDQGDPTDWTPRLSPIDVSFARERRAFRQRFIRRYRR